MASRRAVGDQKALENGHHEASEEKPTTTSAFPRPSLQLTSMAVVVVFCSIAAIAFLAGLTTGPSLWPQSSPDFIHTRQENRYCLWPLTPPRAQPSIMAAACHNVTNIGWENMLSKLHGSRKPLACEQRNCHPPVRV